MDILQMISCSMMVIFLGLSAVFDARLKKIPVILAASGFICGIIMQLIIGELKIYEIIGGCVIGVVFIILAGLTRGAVGWGDGLVLIATGAFLGIMNNVLLLVVSLGLAGLFSAVMLTVKKLKRKSEIPFVPFMLGGYVVILAFL